MSLLWKKANAAADCTLISVLKRKNKQQISERVSAVIIWVNS
jgi:hypothetical protein